MDTKEREMTQDKERPAGSQSLFRGLMLIEILSNYPNGCPLAHLSELAGLNKSTVHRLLQGLQSCGYVTPAPAAGSYRLTTKFIAVGQKALSSLNIIHVAAPHLETLNLVTGETVNFSSREDDHAILIYKLEPTTGLPAMHDELAQIRERNMAMDREENELGVSCLAVPVFDIHRRVPYAISISLSTSRLKQVGEKNLLKPLRDTAEAISRELGFAVRES